LFWKGISGPANLPKTGGDSHFTAAPGLAENATPHSLDPLLDFARKALQNHIKNHRDYQATLIKREKVGNRELPESKMAMKLKYRRQLDPVLGHRPVSVYLKTLEPRSQAGREVIWVQGQNDNKMKVHESGFLGMISVELMPESRLAMAGNRYPISEIGLEKLLGKLIERGERDRELGPATIRTTENAQVGGRTCRLMEIIHESPNAVVDGKTVEFEFFLAQVFIDDELMLPLKFASFTWPKVEGGPPELIEEYAYHDLELNVGLEANDFNASNPEYRF